MMLRIWKGTLDVLPELALVDAVHGRVGVAGKLTDKVLGVGEGTDDPELAGGVGVAQHLVQQRLRGHLLTPDLRGLHTLDEDHLNTFPSCHVFLLTLSISLSLSISIYLSISPSRSSHFHSRLFAGSTLVVEMQS